MNREFIIGLKEHRIFGWIAKAYWVERQNKEFFTVVESLSRKNLGEKINEYSEAQQKLIKIIDNYTDSEITKLFSKKKLSTRDFINKFNNATHKVQIRDYIEKRLVKLFDVLKDSHIPLYFNTDSKNIYDEEKIDIQQGFSETIFNFSKENDDSKYFLTINDGGSELTCIINPLIYLQIHLVVYFLKISFIFLKLNLRVLMEKKLPHS